MISLLVLSPMAGVEEILTKMKQNPKGVRFNDLCKICDFYFGPARQKSGSHRIYKTPWPGDPRVNIQNDKGFAKIYQIKQVLLAIEKMGVSNDPKT